MDSRLGASEPTRFTLWHSDVQAVAFCAGVYVLRAGANSTISCSPCEGELAQANAGEAACAIPGDDGQTEVATTRCACQSLIDLPLCTEPTSARTRRLRSQ